MNIKKITPDFIQSLIPYTAGKTIAEVEETYKPHRISKLASNENRLGCSPAVKEAVDKALGSVHDYPDPISWQLRQKIAVRYNVQGKNILIGAGSESLISILCRTFFNPNENAVTANVTFVGFFVQAGIRSVHLKKVPITQDYRFDVERMIEAIDANTKMVYIANPNNPTGTYINSEMYHFLASNIPEDVLLVMDEAYNEYAGGVDDYPQTIKHLRPNIILLRTFSKAYGLAGFRIGYAIADEKIIEQMLKVKLTFEPTAMAQAAALAAFDDQEFIDRSVDVVDKGRQRLYSIFDELGIEYVKSISNSVLMVMKNEEEAAHLTGAMLEKGVILRQTTAFGLPNGIRVTVGTEADINHFETALKQVAEMNKQ